VRKIKIDAVLRKEVNDFCDNLFAKRNTSFTKPSKKLTELRDEIKSKRHAPYKDYIQRIIIKYPELLKADPEEMISFINEFSLDFPTVKLSSNIPFKKIKFHEAIVTALRYDSLREKEFPDYLKEKSIRACVYCNANSVLVVDITYRDKKKKKIKARRARLELDHFHPKSQYPFLCTSFFNLYPVCGNCNRSKSDKPASFQLYTKGDELEVFNYWIDDLSIINYWNNKGKSNSELKVWFQSVNGDVDLIENHNELFQVQGITDCNVDLVEELVHKAKVYNDSYKKTIVDSFKGLFPDTTLINRLLIGNYDKPEDIHKRPMAKFTQDIAKQLGLI
jgi:hypothetical protein